MPNEPLSPNDPTPLDPAAALLSEVVDRLTGSQASLGDGLRVLNTQVEQLRAFTQTQTGATQENTAALSQNTQARATGSSGQSIAGNAARTAASVFTSGFGLSPVISGLLRLFGRGSEPAPAPALPRFALPDPLQTEAAISQDGASPLQALRYSEQGLPQTIPASPAAASRPAVTVNINAIDSRSFLDHSDEIARAVRAAMLENHDLNGVISEI
jgi:hypothetical protein